MAVYTHLNPDDVRDYLAQYDVGALEVCEPIAEGVTNTNYFIKAGGVKYILTLFEKHFELAELPYFTALMGWWQAQGIHCPRPIPMNNGRQLGALKGKPALLVSFLDGSGTKNITPEHLRLLGSLMADMHIAGMDFPHRRENHLSLKGWEKLIDDTALRLDEITPGLQKLVSEEYNYLSENWPNALPSGPIHADLFPDNVFFEKRFGEKLELSGVIDFYFACHDAWAYDLAIAINAWCFDTRGRLSKECVQALMDSYNDKRSLTPEEDAAFPLLLRGAALRFLLTRSYAWLNRDEGALVSPKDPLEYEAKLKFFQTFAP